MAIVFWEKEGSVARLVMDQAENRHNPEFLEEILTAFDEIEADSEIEAVVLTSSDQKNWSLGIDLEWMIPILGDSSRHGEVKQFLYRLDDLFKRLLIFPVPIIAAISGHAFGDGAIMACACDFRLMRSDRGFFCFPEVDISIPFMPGMWAIVKRAIPYSKLYEMTLCGKRVGGPELCAAGGIIQTVEGVEGVNEAAMEFAKTFHKKRGIFSEMKGRANMEAIRVIDEDDPEVIDSMRLLPKVG